MYNVRITRQAMKDIADLPKGYARLVSQHIEGLAQNSHPPDSKRLKAELTFSLRVGMYRILYEVDDQARVVTIFRIKHRREAYR